MITTFKYEMPILEKFVLNLPKNAQIIRVDDVEGKFYLWAVVDTEAIKEAVYFECYKTGQQILTSLDYLKYIGFCQLWIAQELCLYFYIRVGPKECIEGNHA